jgi:acetyl-CoA carboxylase beta subunit
MINEKEYENDRDTEPLIKCRNEQCGEFIYKSELEKTKGICPYCGKPITKPE